MTAQEMICFDGIVLFNKARPLSGKERKIVMIADCFRREGGSPLTIDQIYRWLVISHPNFTFTPHYIRRHIRSLVESGFLSVTKETKNSKRKSYTRG